MSYKAVSALLFLVLTASCSKEGPQGNPGEKGDSGPGLIGHDGAPGQDGKDGINGKDGNDGKDGTDGPVGSKGEDLRTVELRNIGVSTDRAGALLTNLSKTIQCSVELRSSDGRLPQGSHLIMNIIADDQVRVANLPTTMRSPGVYEASWTWDANTIGKAKTVQCAFQLIGTEALIADQTSTRISYLNEFSSEYNLAHMNLTMELIDSSWHLVLTPSDSDIRQPAQCKAVIRSAYNDYLNRQTSFVLSSQRAALRVITPTWMKHADLISMDISCRPSNPGEAILDQSRLWLTVDKDTAAVGFTSSFWKNPYTNFAYYYLDTDKELPIFPVVPADATSLVKRMVENILDSQEHLEQNLQKVAALGPGFITATTISRLSYMVKSDKPGCDSAFKILDQVARAKYSIESRSAQDALEEGLDWTFKNGTICRSTAFRYGYIYNKIPADIQEKASTYFEDYLNYIDLADWQRICRQSPSIWQEKFLNSKHSDVITCRLQVGDKVEDTNLVAQSIPNLAQFGMTWEFIKSRVKDPAELIVSLFKTSSFRSVSDLRKEDLSKLKAFMESLAATPSDLARSLFRAEWTRLGPAVTGASPTLQTFLLETARNRPAMIALLLAANPTSTEYHEYFKGLASQSDLKLKMDGLLGRLAIEQNDAAFQELLSFIETNERTFDSNYYLTLGRILPYVGTYKTALFEQVILPYVSSNDFCYTDILQAISDLSIKSEQTLDFVQTQLKTRSTCSIALKTAVSLGRDTWKNRADDLLQSIQQENRFESTTWVRTAALLIHLGFFKETMQQMVFSDLDTIQKNLDFYGDENGIIPSQLSERTIQWGEMFNYQSNGPSAFPLISLLYSIGPKADFATSRLFSMLGRPLLNTNLEMQIGFVLSQMQPNYRPVVFDWLIESQSGWSRQAAYYFAEP